jgi:hypothetical protein
MLIHSKELLIGGGNKFEKLYRRQVTHKINGYTGNAVTEYIYYFGKLKPNVNTVCFNRYFPLWGVSGTIGASNSTVSGTLGSYTLPLAFQKQDFFSDKMPCYRYFYDTSMVCQAQFLSPNQNVNDYVVGWDWLSAKLTNVYFNLNDNGTGTIYLMAARNDTYSILSSGIEEEVKDYIYRP